MGVVKLTNIEFPEKTFDFEKATQELLCSIGEEETNRLFCYEYCEVGGDFVGFIENYYDLKDLPKDFTIIDFGSYQSFQGDYFKEHEKYIGVEPAVPLENRLNQANAEYYELTAQDFIRDVLPDLISNGLDPEKIFAVCSAVPDCEARKQVEETFMFHRIAYPAEQTISEYPDGFISRLEEEQSSQKDKKRVNTYEK